MISLVIGAPACGKSGLAEELSLRTGDLDRYYLATMLVMDSQGAQRVEQHRKQREGKGFVTIERGTDINGALEEMSHPESSTVLLECVSNLVGNEMHEDPFYRDLDADSFAEGITEEIRGLAGKVHHLIVVSTIYPPEDPLYDESTLRYIRYLDTVNQRLRVLADEIHDLSPGDMAEKEG